MRDSPAVEICERLVDHGSVVTAYDPMVPEAVGPPRVRRAAGPLEAAESADAILIATEWPQFLSLDLPRLRERMRGRLLVDGRNLFDPARVRAAGFEYVGVGRRSSSPDVLVGV